MIAGAESSRADRIDLHTHSTASDGELSPSDLVAAAVAAGVTVLALTDHDTLAGVPEAACAAEGSGIEIIPAVEIGCQTEDGGITDILGYFVDGADPGLQALFERIRRGRLERAREMVERLRRLGVAVTIDDVAAVAGAAPIGRPHVAQALAASGAVRDARDAFATLIGVGGPAYVPRLRLQPDEACAVIRAAGGVPSMAHPVPPPRAAKRTGAGRDPKRLRECLPGLVEAGLGGLECHYPGYGPSTVRWLTALADHHGLVPTGGSDFHGPCRPEQGLGCVDVPRESVERLRRSSAAAI